MKSVQLICLRQEVMPGAEASTESLRIRLKSTDIHENNETEKQEWRRKDYGALEYHLSFTKFPQRGQLSS